MSGPRCQLCARRLEGYIGATVSACPRPRSRHAEPGRRDPRCGRSDRYRRGRCHLRARGERHPQGLGRSDLLVGGRGADRLFGGFGNDRLFGGPVATAWMEVPGTTSASGVRGRTPSSSASASGSRVETGANADRPSWGPVPRETARFDVKRGEVDSRECEILVPAGHFCREPATVSDEKWPTVVFLEGATVFRCFRSGASPVRHPGHQRPRSIETLL